jgi:hypothetical protein
MDANELAKYPGLYQRGGVWYRFQPDDAFEEWLQGIPNLTESAASNPIAGTARCGRHEIAAKQGRDAPFPVLHCYEPRGDRLRRLTSSHPKAHPATGHTSYVSWSLNSWRCRPSIGCLTKMEDTNRIVNQVEAIMNVAAG